MNNPTIETKCQYAVTEFTALPELARCVKKEFCFDALYLHEKAYCRKEYDKVMRKLRK